MSNPELMIQNDSTDKEICLESIDRSPASIISLEKRANSSSSSSTPAMHSGVTHSPDAGHLQELVQIVDAIQVVDAGNASDLLGRGGAKANGNVIDHDEDDIDTDASSIGWPRDSGPRTRRSPPASARELRQVGAQLLGTRSNNKGGPRGSNTGGVTGVGDDSDHLSSDLHAPRMASSAPSSPAVPRTLKPLVSPGNAHQQERVRGNGTRINARRWHAWSAREGRDQDRVSPSTGIGSGDGMLAVAISPPAHVHAVASSARSRKRRSGRSGSVTSNGSSSTTTTIPSKDVSGKWSPPSIPAPPPGPPPFTRGSSVGSGSSRSSASGSPRRVSFRFRKPNVRDQSAATGTGVLPDFRASRRRMSTSSGRSWGSVAWRKEQQERERMGDARIPMGPTNRIRRQQSGHSLASAGLHSVGSTGPRRKSVPTIAPLTIEDSDEERDQEEDAFHASTRQEAPSSKRADRRATLPEDFDFGSIERDRENLLRQARQLEQARTQLLVRAEQLAYRKPAIDAASIPAATMEIVLRLQRGFLSRHPRSSPSAAQLAAAAADANEPDSAGIGQLSLAQRRSKRPLTVQIGSPPSGIRSPGSETSESVNSAGSTPLSQLASRLGRVSSFHAVERLHRRTSGANATVPRAQKRPGGDRRQRLHARKSPQPQPLHLNARIDSKGDPWIKYRTPAGAAYYHNMRTSEVSWTRPDFIPAGHASKPLEFSLTSPKAINTPIIQEHRSERTRYWAWRMRQVLTLRRLGRRWKQRALARRVLRMLHTEQEFESAAVAEGDSNKDVNLGVQRGKGVYIFTTSERESPMDAPTEVSPEPAAEGGVHRRGKSQKYLSPPHLVPSDRKRHKRVLSDPGNEAFSGDLAPKPRRSSDADETEGVRLMSHRKTSEQLLIAAASAPDSDDYVVCSSPVPIRQATSPGMRVMLGMPDVLQPRDRSQTDPAASFLPLERTPASGVHIQLETISSQVEDDVLSHYDDPIDVVEVSLLHLNDANAPLDATASSISHENIVASSAPRSNRRLNGGISKFRQNTVVDALVDFDPARASESTIASARHQTTVESASMSVPRLKIPAVPPLDVRVSPPRSSRSMNLSVNVPQHAPDATILSPASVCSGNSQRSASGASNASGRSKKGKANRGLGRIPSNLLTRSLSLWDELDVQRFLSSLGISDEIISNFSEALIDGPFLMELDDADLVDLGVSNKFQRRKVLQRRDAVCDAQNFSWSAASHDGARSAHHRSSVSSKSVPNAGLDLPGSDKGPSREATASFRMNSPHARSPSFSRHDSGADIVPASSAAAAAVPPSSKYPNSPGLSGPIPGPPIMSRSISTQMTILPLEALHPLTRIGAGSGGVVFFGMFEGQKVVVKAPRNADVSPKDIKELQIHLHIPRHDHIVDFIGICWSEDNSQLYVVSRFVDHGSLLQLFRTRSQARFDGDSQSLNLPPLSWLNNPLFWIRGAADVADALLHLHRHQVVHCDVAARNVLINSEGRFVLADFGLSHKFDRYDNRAFIPRGSPLPARWTAPEVLTNKIVTVQADVYAFGVFLFELVTLGDTPFSWIEDNLEVLRGVNQGTLSLHRTFPAHTPRILRVVAELCLHVDPTQRPSMQVVSEMLEVAHRQAHRGALESSLIDSLDVSSHNSASQVRSVGVGGGRGGGGGGGGDGENDGNA